MVYLGSLDKEFLNKPAVKIICIVNICILFILYMTNYFGVLFSLRSSQGFIQTNILLLGGYLFLVVKC